jgi:hypothetical protein
MKRSFLTLLFVLAGIMLLLEVTYATPPTPPTHPLRVTKISVDTVALNKLSNVTITIASAVQLSQLKAYIFASEGYQILA